MRYESIRRILVTGSRGKSSLVRLIHAACLACGLNAYGRITGVLPRELSPRGENLILRRAGAHVAEMSWWLKQLPDDSDAVIMENSAIRPDLQHLAARWLGPDLVVMANARPDHQQAWGADHLQVIRTLALGIPPDSVVVTPGGKAADPEIRKVLNDMNCRVVSADPASGFADDDHRASNIGLALAVCVRMGLDPRESRKAMAGLAPDLADFRVESLGKGKLAVAFSANDPFSTGALFRELGWPRRETTLLYNHRADRVDRLKAFSKFMDQPWRKLLVMGQRPLRLPAESEFVRISNTDEMKTLVAQGGRFFGCGNMAGTPLAFLLARHFPQRKEPLPKDRS